MAQLTWTEIHRESWSEHRPARFGGPAGTDHFTTIYARATWPDNGSIYAGRTYEMRTTWIGPEQGMLHVVNRRDEYPAERSPLAI